MRPAMAAAASAASPGMQSADNAEKRIDRAFGLRVNVDGATREHSLGQSLAQFRRALV